MREKTYREKLTRLVYLKGKRKGGRKLPDARFMHATHAVWDKRPKTSKAERG